MALLFFAQRNTECQVPSLLTYLLTPRNRVLLEKLAGSAASQEIPRIFGNRRFITVLTSARHLSLSWANSIRSPQPPSHFLKSYLNIILPSASGSPQWSLSLRFPHQNPVYPSPLPHTCHIPRPSHSYRATTNCLKLLHTLQMVRSQHAFLSRFQVHNDQQFLIFVWPCIIN